MIRLIEGQLQDLMGRFRRRFPELSLTPWSHSVAALTLDGWSFGFRVEGLAAPLDFEMVILRAHSPQPELERARANWRKPGWDLEWEVVDLVRESQLEPEREATVEGLQVLRRELAGAEVPGPSALLARVGDRLLRALERAVASGPRRQGHTLTCRVSYKDTDEEPETVPLSEDEQSVLAAWSSYLRQRGFSPLQLQLSYPDYALRSFHLHAPGQAFRVAPGLGEVPEPAALVHGLLGEPFPRPEGWLEGAGWGELVERDFYRDHPSAHGWMGVARPGIAGDGAVVLVSNWVGYGGLPQRWNPRPKRDTPLQRVDRLGNGYHLVTFCRVGRGWQLRELYRISANRLSQLQVEVAVGVHFDSRIRVLERGPHHFRMLWEGREFFLLDPQLLQEREPFACPLPAVLSHFDPPAVVTSLNQLLEQWHGT